MLVTFHTKAHHDITMFDNAAKPLLQAMGLSGFIPSAIHAEDVPAALEKLRLHLADLRPVKRPEPKEDDEDPRVSLSVRAYPLMRLLEAAAAENCPVIWRRG